MPAVKCPHCQNRFEWTEEMGEGRVECPLCNKMMEIVRRKGRGGGKTQGDPEAKFQTTTWGTDGFRSARRRAEYGEIRKDDMLGGFRIEEMVGAGAMAVVYKATQISLDRIVALKILPKDFAKRESFVRQFDSETELLASLNHPNIVNIIDRGREEDTYFFAMEFVEGTTLGELLAASELDEAFFIQIMEQCAEALTYAHSRGIIHRDIKPANIMLNTQGMVKIADFGVAGLIAEAGDDESRKKRVMGTRGYMPPEQEIHIDRTDERSDIFSLGAVMYRALTNTIPDFLPPDPPSKLAPDIDPRLDRIVLTCLEVKPDRRYQSAKELLEALRAYHREITRAHEVCPECKKENPPTRKECLHCGADLSALFDVCPECAAENRADVDICMGCGTSLSRLRQRTSVRISRTEEKARELASHHRYDDAIAQLQHVLGVKGKAFQRSREKAERLIANYTEQRQRYYQEKISEGRRLASEGKLNEAMAALTSVPAEFAEPHGMEVLILDVKSRMAEAEQKLAGWGELVRERRFDDAESLLNEVASAWADCPGLEDARRQLHGGRETQEMVEYELSEVEKHLQNGQLAEARQAIDFAMRTMPDNPRVKELSAEIERREKAALLKNAVAQGRKAFEEGRFMQATRFWLSACDLLPEDDERHKKLVENIGVARRRALEEEVVRLEEAKVVLLSPRGEESGSGLSTKKLLFVLAAVGVAVVLAAAAVVFLVLSGES